MTPPRQPRFQILCVRYWHGKAVVRVAFTILVTEVGTNGASAFWATNSLPSASITSTSPDGASTATFSLTPARAGAGSRRRARRSRRDHMATPAWDRVGAQFTSVQRNCCALARSTVTHIAHELGSSNQDDLTYILRKETGKPPWSFMRDPVS